MKKIALSLLAAMGVAVAFADDFDAVKAIVGRLAGGYNGAAEAGADTAKANAAMAQFVFVQDGSIAAGAGKVEAADGKIKITASDASGASFALGQYLRHTAKVHISWCGNRTIETYPVPAEAATYTPAVPVRFAYNYCTLSYTMAFWSANEWREEIDRLALSGYNVALVLQGLQEAWRVTLESVKKANGDRVYSNEQIMKYVSDEAAQAWWHMGNLEGLGGPLGGEKGDYAAPDAYAKFTARCQKDAILGEYIYAEMMKLGIQPSIQSFVGLVPDCSNQVLADGVANGQRFGDAANWGIINEGSWQGYTRPDVVNPLNIAFDEMSKAWYGALVNIYKPETHGYTSFMGGDLFHEGGNKGSLTDADLANIAKKIQDTQAQYFGKNGNVVTWVIQSWQGSPYQGIRNGLDCSKAIIQLLDKDMSTTGPVGAEYWNSTTGKHIPWIWVEVLNFGGNTGMHGGSRRLGNLAKIGTSGDKSNPNSHAGSFRGYGILSEGLETNPMMYDMINDAFTREVGTSSSLDTDAKMAAWIHDYLVRRYGAENVCDELEEAYAVLIKTVFDCSRYQEGCVENVLCAGANYSVAAVSKWGPKDGIEYDPVELYPAARAYLAAVEKKPALKHLETFKYDFVELFLQLLGERGRVINNACASSAKKRAEFLTLLDLAEKITACSPRWRLDWHEARTKGVCPVDTNGQSEGIRGYRRMVTCWADGYAAGQATGLREYAHRAYSGLFKDYYKKRWEWFFQVTEGAITQAKYVQNLTELDDTFPTAILEPTPEGDMVKIAEEILLVVCPPAFTWNGEAGDDVWENANWKDGGTLATTVWVDGQNAVLSGLDKTITVNEQATVGNISFEKGTKVADNQGWLDTTTPIVLAANTTIEEAHTWDFTGVMSGGWFGNPQRLCAATAYHKSAIADKAFTVQFQAIDVSDGTSWLKAVSARIYQDGADVKILSTDAAYKANGTLGSGPLDAMSNIPATSGGYCIKEIVTYRPSSVTITGKLTVEGEVSLTDGEMISLPGVSQLETISVDAGTATLKLGDSQKLSIGLLSVGSGAKLVVKGSAPVLYSGRLTLSKTDAAKAVYVGPDGVEQPLIKAADGSVRSAFQEAVVGDWIPKSVVSTGLYGVTLKELATRFVITGMMDGGFVPTTKVNAYCGTLADNKYTVQMQTVDGGYLKVVCLEFTEVNGEIKVEAKWIRNRSGAVLGTDCTSLSNSTNWGSPDVVTDTSSNGYGIYNLTLTPAVAMVNDVPYTTLTDAISAANGAMITIITDMSIGKITTYPIKLEVPEGVELKVTAGDFLDWNKAWELHVKGTVSLGANALSYGEAVYTAQKIYLYEGGAILNTSGHGFSVFENSTIYVKHIEGKEPALIGATLQARKNITIEVEEGATAIVETNVMDKDGQSGIASPKIIKTGDGELVWNGYFQSENVSLELNGGTLTRALEDNEVFTLTETSGTATITTANPDYKVEVVAGENNVKTYTAVPRTYLVKVTNPGETGQNGAGKLFETYGEAAAYACELQAKTPAILVIMWTVVDNRGGLNSDSTFTAALAVYNAKHETEMTLDTITAKSPDGEQFEHELWDTTEIYQDPSKQNDVYYPMNATEWTTAVKAKTKAVDGVDVVMTADHKVIFNQNYGPIYINTGILPRSMKVTNNSTLTLGYWSGTSSLPSGMTVEIDAGSTAQFDNWANGWPVKVPNATINGEGSVVFGPTITGSSVVEIGTLAGTAALTLKSGVTVIVNNAIANTLKGTGTIKVMSIPATFSVADGANVTFVDGTTHDARETMKVVKSGTTVSITHELVIAKVGDTAYSDLAAAIAAAQALGDKTITLYISEDDYFRNGAVSVGDADLTGLMVKVRMPDSREEFSLDGTFDPVKKQVTFSVIVKGPAALYDWTFDGNASTKGIASVGRDTSTINCDGNNNYQWSDDGSMKSKCHPYFGVNCGSSAITLATFLSAGTVEDTVLVALGNTGNAVALVKAAEANTIKLAAIRNGEQSDISGAILVPNVAQQHLYMVVVSADRRTVTLWIDGNLWETYNQEIPVSIDAGLQVGSVYAGTPTGLKSESADAPTVKMIRVFTNELGEACALALKSEFEYRSNAGAYSRTITTGEANWVSENAWRKIGSDPVETLDEPLEGSVPVLVVTCDTVITVNTSAPMTFEAMTIRSQGGAAHTVTFKFADDTTDEGRANKLMPAMALVESGITVITQYAAFETLGSRLRLENNAHLKFSYAGLDPWEVLGLTISGQVSSAVEMGEGSTVEVIKPNMDGLESVLDFVLTEENGAYYVTVSRIPNQSLDVTWDSAKTYWSAGVTGKIAHNGKLYDVIIQSDDIVHFSGVNNRVGVGDGSQMPNVQLFVESDAKVTFSGHLNSTAINGEGTVAFAEKNLVLPEAISGTVTFEIAADQTLTVPQLSTPVKGSGKIILSSLPTSEKLLEALQNVSVWTGTLVIKGVTGVRDLDLSAYGNANSKVELDGVSGYFANNEHSFGGTLVIGKDGLTITDGYSTYGVYKFAKVSGTGTISMTKSSVTHKFMIDNAADFRGSIQTVGSPFTIGTTADGDKNTTAATVKVMGATGSMSIGGGCTFADGALVLDSGSATTTDDCVAGGERALVLGANGVTITSANEHLIVKSGVVGKVVKHVGDIYSLDDPTGTTVTTGASYDYAAPSFDVANAGAAAPVTVTIRDRSGVVKFTKEGVTDNDGTLHFVCTGTEDDGKVALEIGTEYSYEVYVNGQKVASDTFFTAGLNTWFGADATNGGDAKVGGDWATGTAPTVDNNVYALDSSEGHQFNITSGDKGAGRLSYVEQKVTFTSAIENEDLASANLGTDAFGAITIATDGNDLTWRGYIDGAWGVLYDTEPPVLNMEYLIRTDLDRAASPKTISYVVNGHHLKDGLGNTSWSVANDVVFKAISYKGSGMLAKMEGVVPSTAVAKVGTTEYGTIEAALADETYSASKPVVLLTSVLWAPATGTYYITKGAYDIKVVNEKILSWSGEGTVATVSEPTAPVEGFTAPTEQEKSISIDPTWLNAVVPGGKTIKDIQKELDKTPAYATMTRMEAYVLGIPASDVETAKVTVASEQTPEPNTLMLGLAGVKPRTDTGVTVKVQVLEADTPDDQSFVPGDEAEGTSVTFSLPNTKVKYYRLKVKFE